MSAIFMGKDYELAVYSNKDFIWDKQDLLVPAVGDAGADRRCAEPARPTCRGFSTRSISACSCATAPWARCSTRKGIFLNRCFDELNLTQPDLVAEVHREYVRAGADVIETNTFGANRFKLANFGLARPGARHQPRRRAAGAPRGARAAPGWPARSGRSASASSRGAGPASTRPRRRSASRPRRWPRAASICSSSRRSATCRELAAAIRARARRVGAADRRADDDRRGRQQRSTARRPSTFAPALERAGRRRHRRSTARSDRRRCSRRSSAWRGCRPARLAAQPNAGRPRDVDGRNLYLSSPEYMASYARRFVAAGVRLVGGCCGTTPEHTRQIAQAVRGDAPGGPRAAASVTRRASRPSRRRPRSTAATSPRLARALADRPLRGARRDQRAARSRPVDRRPRPGPAVPRPRRRSPSTCPTTRESGARASALALAALHRAAPASRRCCTTPAATAR